MRPPRLPWLLPVLPVFVLAGCEPFTPWYDHAAIVQELQPDQSLQSVPHPQLQFIGRMDFSTPEGPTYAHSGGTIRFRCDCTGVDVAFTELGEGGEEHTNHLNVLVDGKHAATVELRKGSHVYRGARDLSKGEHVIEVVKRTEAYAGKVQFLGLSLQGELLEPPPRLARRMEVLGDSISCGYGNEASILAPTYTEPTTGYHSRNEDVSKSYGSLLARRWGAELITTCISGTGVYRNLDGATTVPFPVLYERIYPSEYEPLWDPSRFIPDLIVINLGNNDFSVRDESNIPSAPPLEPFKQAYAAFLRKLRGLYPAAKIICTIGPTTTDFYPPGRQHWTLLQQYVSEMVDEVRAQGDRNVHYFPFTPLPGDPYGEDWHPTAEGHAKMADELYPYLKELGL